MAERTPPTVAIKQAWIVGHPFRATTTVEGREAEFDRWLAEVKAEAWDEGAQAGLDAGLSIAEAVHANGGVLNLADVPNAPVNPYRAAVRPSGQEQDCNCGFGGQHDPGNPRCRVNDPTEAWLRSGEQEGE